jgi:hypothetical protein
VTYDDSALLEIFLDPFGLAEQERDVLIGRVDEPLDHLEGLFEFLDELVVFTVAPGLAQTAELTVQRGQLRHHLVIELLEPGRKSSEIFRVNNGLSHFGPHFRDGDG